MSLPWGRERRREALLATGVPRAFDDAARQLWFAPALETRTRRRWIDVARVIEAEKNWEGVGELEVTAGMRALVALQAALLLVNREHDHYETVVSILLMPGAYRSHHPYADELGIVAEGTELVGEAVHRDAVVLSWPDVEVGLEPGDGYNVVLHEFAHQLDLGADGVANGTPALGAVAADRWRDVMARRFAALTDAVERDEEPFLDPYGATDESEFFAVAVETFFDDPTGLRAAEPELYALLRDVFQLDPVTWRGPLTR